VLYSATGSGTNVDGAWDGSGASQDGAYDVTLEMTDQAANVAVVTAEVIRDTTPPAIGDLAVSNEAFSPNGDGVKDTTTITATLTDAWTPISWTLQIKQGTTVVMTASGTGNVPYAWDGTNTSGALVADGSYTAHLTATDAGNNVRTPNPISILLDTVLPEAKAFTPQDDGNTVYASQQIQVKVVDPGNVSELASASVTLTDETDASASPNTHALSPYFGRQNWYHTDAQSLTVGHRYRAEASLFDAAGNVGTATWRFLAIPAPVAQEAPVVLSAEGTDTGQAGATIGTRRWSFTPRLTIDRRTLTLQNGSQHPGWGIATSSVDLSSARYTVSVAGQPSTWSLSQPYPAGTTRSVYQQFSYTSTAQESRNLRVPGITVGLAEVFVDLPVAVERATMAFSSPVMTTTSIGSLCQDPLAGLAGCNPDPLRVHVADALADRLEETAAEVHGQGSDIDPSPAPADEPAATFLFTVMTVVPDPDSPTSLDWMWKRIVPASVQTSCATVGADGMCWLDGVGYPSTGGLMTTADFGPYCATVLFCTSAAHTEEADAKYGCVNKHNGHDQVTDPDGCQQHSAMSQPDVVRNPIYSWDDPSNCPPIGVCSTRMNTTYLFAAWNHTDWGFADALPNGTNELGISWQSVVQDENANGDTYVRYQRWVPAVMPDTSEPLKRGGVQGEFYPEYSPGVPDEEAVESYVWCGDRAPAETNWEMNPVFYGGNGKGPQGFTTGRPGTYSDDPNDHGWPQWTTKSCLKPNGNQVSWYKRILDGGMAGYWKLDAEDGGSLTRSDGYVESVFGHVMRIHDWRWSFSAGPSCGAVTTGCSLIGIGFNPYDEQREEEFAQPVSRAFKYQSNF
ncbi:MAG TPA: FlgD immunoglobulin-like domain containing protein, partial [Actinomycetota bacterium]